MSSILRTQNPSPVVHSIDNIRRFIEFLDGYAKCTASKIIGGKAPKKISQRERIHRRYCRYWEPFIKGGYVEVTLEPGEKLRPRDLIFQVVGRTLDRLSGFGGIASAGLSFDDIERKVPSG